MIHLDLKGSDYEIGYAHGRKCAREARQCVETWGRIDHPDREQIDRVLEDAVRDIQARIPWFDERMRGISDGSGISLKDIQQTNLCEMLWNEVTGWCSVLAVRRPDGHIYLGKTSDTGTGSAAFHIFERLQPRQGLAFIRANFAGYAGTCAGLNEMGLAFAGASIKVLPSDFRAGLPLEPLAEDVLRGARTCQEAVTRLKAFDVRSQGAHMVFADAVGRACAVLKYPGVQRVAWIQEGFLAVTNHAVSDDRSYGILPGDDTFAGNSRQRLAHLRYLAPETHGDLAAIQRLFHTRLAEGGVFQENDPLLGTCAAYVLAPHEGIMYVAHGESTAAEFVPYTLDAHFADG